MATTAQEWQESGNDMNGNHPEPVITYDHMSDSEQFLYLSQRHKMPTVSNTRILMDYLLITGMMIALLMMSL